LERTSERNNLLAESWEKKLDSVQLEIFNEKHPRPDGIPRPDEVVHIYEMQIDNRMKLMELDAEYKKVNSTTDSLCPHVDADIEFCKAARCFYLGLNYTDENKIPEALALMERAVQRLEKAVQLGVALGVKDEHFQQRADKLGNRILSWKPFLRASSFLEKMKTNEPPVMAPQVEENTGDSNQATTEATQDDPTFIEFPPRLDIIACKPLLFDLALQQCKYPSLEEKKKAPRSGFFGLFSKQ